MIRFRNEIIEEYDINPWTAAITDKNGVIQKPCLNRAGRPCFHKMLIHQIQVHTWAGYRPNMDIHHLDGDKFNNALYNLVYLTHSEHTRMHKQGTVLSEETKQKLRRHHTEEAKQKMSNSRRGKKFSDEHKQKISNAKVGKHWWHNNDIEVCSKECPVGFVKGRLR